MQISRDSLVALAICLAGAGCNDAGSRAASAATTSGASGWSAGGSSAGASSGGGSAAGGGSTGGAAGSGMAGTSGISGSAGASGDGGLGGPAAGDASTHLDATDAAAHRDAGDAKPRVVDDAATPIVGGFCSIRTNNCLALLAECPELTACQADRGCAAKADDAFACLCGGEQLGDNDGDAGPCARMYLGVPTSLSGRVIGCFEQNAATSAACLVSVPWGCNGLELVQPLIVETSVAHDPPVPTGGKIEDGTYVLTEQIDFTGPSGTTGIKDTGTYETLKIDHGAMYIASLEVAVGSTKRGRREAWTFELTGPSLTATLTCPPTEPFGSLMVVYGFDATPTRVTLYLNSSRRTFTKQ